jgi:hypothetical protein
MDEKALTPSVIHEISVEDLLIVELDDRLELAAMIVEPANNGCTVNSGCNFVSGCGASPQ